MIELLEEGDKIESISIGNKKADKKKRSVTWGDEHSDSLVEIGEAIEYDRKLYSYQKKSRRKYKVEFCSDMQVKIFIGVGIFLALILIILIVLIFTVFIP